MKPRHATPATQVLPQQSARAVGLRYVNDSEPGIWRIRGKAGFRYQDAQGRPVRDGATLRRIRSLAIPPAWDGVWICRLGNGHLQATGRDAKGRKQHRYHPLWREQRDATKYDRMIDFARALPRMRKQVTRHLSRRALDREKVQATIVRLMDLTFIRVGNEEYAKKNHSYGLTTMKDQHATIRGARVEFSFRGKSGKCHRITLEDQRLARIVKNCQDIPGQDLFQYYEPDGSRRDVTSGDVNQYLREISGTDFTAKDFRTWAGTVLAAQALAACPDSDTKGQARKNVKQAIATVAAKLGNTPAVCRKCYIHPLVLDGYQKKTLPRNIGSSRASTGAITAGTGSAGSLSAAEKCVLRFLECCRRNDRARARRLAPRVARLPQSWRPRLR